MQDESVDVLRLIVAFLLYDGRENDGTFLLMSTLGAFPKLLALIEMGKDEESGLYKTMLDLIFEMSRMHRLRNKDLCKCCGQSGFDKRNLMKNLVGISDDSIMYFFNMIEAVSENINDPYHYSLIKVLVRLSPKPIDAIILIIPIPSSFSTNNIWLRPIVAIPMHTSS